MVSLLGSYERRFGQSCDVLRSEFYIFLVAHTSQRGPLSFVSVFLSRRCEQIILREPLPYTRKNVSFNLCYSALLILWNIFCKFLWFGTFVMFCNYVYYVSKVKKLVTLVEGELKAPLSIATTPRCRRGRYSVPRIAPLYPWSSTFSAKQGGIK